MKVDVIASLPHFWDHLEPVWNALPAHVKGDRVDASVRGDRLTMVSAIRDLRACRGPVVFAEHGCGLTYTGTTNASYAGGRGRERVALFLCPNQRTADANLATWPDIPAVVVGSPKMDELTGIPTRGNRNVVFAFHWDCQVVPETRTALPFVRDELVRLVHEPRGWNMLGHGHPRAWTQTKMMWRQMGVPTIDHFYGAVTYGDVLVGDNSSVLYEWAALGRPVVVVNAPGYRRDVVHGLRFWDDVPGPQVNDPHELEEAILNALDHDTWGPERERITQVVYPHLGEATARAVDAIMEAAT